MNMQDTSASLGTMKGMRLLVPLVLLGALVSGCGNPDAGIPQEAASSAPVAPSTAPAPRVTSDVPVDAAQLAERARSAQVEAGTLGVEVEISSTTDEEALGTGTILTTDPCRYSVQDVSGRTTIVEGDIAVETGSQGASQVATAPSGGFVTAVLLPDGLCGVPDLLSALDLREVTGGEDLTYVGTLDPERLQGTYQKRFERLYPAAEADALVAQIRPTLINVSGLVTGVELSVDKGGLVTSLTVRSEDVDERLVFAPTGAEVATELPDSYAPLLGTSAP